MSTRANSHKRLVFLDVETNGLSKIKNDIVQFGAVISSMGNLRDFETVCEYFESTSPVQVQALRVHQIDNLRAKKMTKYQFFEVFVRDTNFFDSSVPTVYVAHNAQFDLGVINNVLVVNGERQISFGEQVRTLGEAARVRGNCWLDSVPYFRDVLGISARGSSSLETLGSRWVKNMELFTRILRTSMEGSGQPVYNLGYHNATFDSFVLYGIFLAHLGKLI